MTTKLRGFFRQQFYPAAKIHLLEMFERDKGLTSAVVLCETTPLNGITITYSWGEHPLSCRLDVSEFNHKQKLQTAIKKSETPKAEFVELIQGIEDLGGAKLGHFAGKVKDGIVYSLCWGTPSRPVCLRIKNPQRGSEKHQQLVRFLKNKAEEN